MKQTIFLFWLLVGVCFFCISCTKDSDGSLPKLKKSVVILYENDVHCAVDGYSKLAGLRNAIQSADTAECIIVSSGDYIQGGKWGALSNGQYIVDLMNAVEYSAVTIGNHEFDFRVPKLLELSDKFNMPVTCVNFGEFNSNERFFKSYVMCRVAERNIAFVGVVSPEALKDEFYAFYDEDGKQQYDLYPNDYISMTQKAVNGARSAGADYVVLLSHLGELDNGFSVPLLIKSTYGIDVVLDGHTHSVINDTSILNSAGISVPLSQTGTNFANIGKLSISKEGSIRTELLPTSEVPYVDCHVKEVYDSISHLVDKIASEKLGVSNHELTILGSDGKRAVRTAETTMGNFAVDAYRYCMKAEIGIVNGGSIRTNLPAGEITYGHFVDICPFFNDAEARELTGKQLRQILEKSYRQLPSENGDFLQVSGLKVQIDLASGKPSVTNVEAVDKTTGQFQLLDDNRTYVVGSTRYVFIAYPEISGCKVVTPVILNEPEALKMYFVEALNGNMGNHYLSNEGRITIVK